MIQRAASKSQRNERGSQTIEAGLICLPFFALVFLILDLSLAIFVKSTLQHSVREGVRFAVTGRLLTGMWHDASIKSVIQQHSLGFLAGSEGAGKIFIVYRVPSTMAETANNVGGNLIEISVRNFQWIPIAPLLRPRGPLNIYAIAADKMEPSPGGVAPKRF
jgi:hypothetical protein